MLSQAPSAYESKEKKGIATQGHQGLQLPFTPLGIVHVQPLGK